MSKELESKQDYFDGVKRKAKIAVDEYKKYQEDYDNINEYIWELVDSDQWIIYNKYNLDVIKYSPTYLSNTTWQAYVDFDKAEASDIFQAMAFTLLERDLYDKIEDLAPELIQ